MTAKRMKSIIPRMPKGSFPIIYNGKEYQKKDCDDVFLAFYHGRHTLNHDCSVYVGDGVSVYPDGKMK